MKRRQHQRENDNLRGINVIVFCGKRWEINVQKSGYLPKKGDKIYSSGFYGKRATLCGVLIRVMFVKSHNFIMLSNLSKIAGIFL